MKRIYSTSYFHYTQSFDTLVSILENGFYSHYCKEQFKYNNRLIDINVPMISFCDVPLSFIEQITYGNYAIGMKSVWGNNVKLTPVCYFPNNSKNSFNRAICGCAYNFSAKSTNLERNLIAYSKPKKKYKNNGHCYDNYKERESRRVYLDKITTKDVHNTRCEPLTLTFEITDISFIIVSIEKEKVKLINKINKMKTIGGKNRKTKDTIPVILTKKEILTNF